MNKGFDLEQRFDLDPPRIGAGRVTTPRRQARPEHTLAGLNQPGKENKNREKSQKKNKNKIK